MQGRKIKLIIKKIQDLHLDFFNFFKITYDIEVTNIGNTYMGILNIAGINLTYSISNYILTALSSPSKNKYSGFLFRCYSQTRFYLNATAQGATSNLNNVPRISDGFRVNSGTETYTLYFKYDPTTTGNPTVTISQTPIASGSSSYALQTANIPTSLPDVTIRISGTDASGSMTKFAKMTVHSFSVTKI